MNLPSDGFGFPGRCAHTCTAFRCTLLHMSAFVSTSSVALAAIPTADMHRFTRTCEHGWLGCETGVAQWY